MCDAATVRRARVRLGRHCEKKGSTMDLRLNNAKSY